MTITADTRERTGKEGETGAPTGKRHRRHSEFRHVRSPFIRRNAFLQGVGSIVEIAPRNDYGRIVQTSVAKRLRYAVERVGSHMYGAMDKAVSDVERTEAVAERRDEHTAIVDGKSTNEQPASP